MGTARCCFCDSSKTTVLPVITRRTANIQTTQASQTNNPISLSITDENYSNTRPKFSQKIYLDSKISIDDIK